MTLGCYFRQKHPRKTLCKLGWGDGLKGVALEWSVFGCDRWKPIVNIVHYPKCSTSKARTLKLCLYIYQILKSADSIEIPSFMTFPILWQVWPTISFRGVSWLTLPVNLRAIASREMDLLLLAYARKQRDLTHDLIAPWLIATSAIAGHHTITKQSWKTVFQRDLDGVVQSVPIILLSLMCLTCGWNLPYCAFSFLGEQRGIDNEVAASPSPQSIYPCSCHCVIKAALLAAENKQSTWGASGFS